MIACKDLILIGFMAEIFSVFEYRTTIFSGFVRKNPKGLEIALYSGETNFF